MYGPCMERHHLWVFYYTPDLWTQKYKKDEYCYTCAMSLHTSTLHVITIPYFSKAPGQTPYTSLKPNLTTVLGWPTLLRSAVGSYGWNYSPELIKSNMQNWSFARQIKLKRMSVSNFWFKRKWSLHTWMPTTENIVSVPFPFFLLISFELQQKN